MELLLIIFLVVVVYLLFRKLSPAQGKSISETKKPRPIVVKKHLVTKTLTPLQRPTTAHISRPTPESVAPLAAAPKPAAKAESPPATTLATTSPARGEIPLSELWQQMLAALELPSARMLLSQQAELVRLDDQRAVVRVSSKWMAMVQSRLPLLEKAVATTLGSPRKLILEDANPATAADPVVPATAQPPAQASHPTPHPEQQTQAVSVSILPIPNSKSSNTPRRNNTPRYPTFDTGIVELDGPGMYQRLTGCGPTGHVLYLLYSEEHNAYKVGTRAPEKIGDRIKAIRASVPDIKLVGTAVFMSRQKAFDKEQEVLQKYKNYKYHGITGRSAGVHEWIKVRPSGKPYLTAPEKVEERFQEEIRRPVQSLEVPDKYTVYLLYSKEQGTYLANWCLSTNLDEKIKKARAMARDAILLSRFKIEEPHKAREITRRMNEEAGTYTRIGQRDVMMWGHNPTYLVKFKNWDEHGMRIDKE